MGEHVLGFWTYPQGHFIKLIRDKEGPYAVNREFIIAPKLSRKQLERFRSRQELQVLRQ